MYSQNKSSILFVIICSNGKRRGGETGNYDPALSIRECLEHRSLEKLFERRNKVLNILHHGNEVSHGGRLLRGLPYNKELVPESPDVRLRLTSTNAKYLPAASRYFGRYYQALDSRDTALLTNSDHHVLIISGLYGLLLPTEHIQCYSCNVVDHPDFIRRWTEEDFLTNLLLEYIERYKIRRVFDFMADDSYRNLLSWQLIKSRSGLSVLHALSEQMAGASLLPSLGHLSQKYLVASEATLLGLRAGTIEPLPSGDVTMQTFLPKATFAPLSPTARDKIGRMRRNMIRMLNLIYGSQKPLYQFRDRVVNLMERGLLDTTVGGQILDFNAVRNKVEYDSKPIDDEQEWERVLALYASVTEWAKSKKHINEKDLEVIDM